MGLLIFLLLIIGFIWICVKFIGSLLQGKNMHEAAKATKPKDTEQTIVTILRIMFMYIPAGIWVIVLLVTLFTNGGFFLMFALVSSIFMIPWLWFFDWFLKK